MTQHDDQITLRQMLDSASEAVEFAQNHTLESFVENRVLCLAIERLLITIGEASSRLSDQTRNSMPQIPWPEIAGFRNRIVHGYDSVDYNRVWQVLQVDVPALVGELEKLNLPEFE